MSDRTLSLCCVHVRLSVSVSASLTLSQKLSQAVCYDSSYRIDVFPASGTPCANVSGQTRGSPDEDTAHVTCSCKAHHLKHKFPPKKLVRTILVALNVIDDAGRPNGSTVKSTLPMGTYAGETTRQRTLIDTLLKVH